MSSPTSRLTNQLFFEKKKLLNWTQPLTFYNPTNQGLSWSLLTWRQVTFPSQSPLESEAKDSSKGITP